VLRWAATHTESRQPTSAKADERYGAVFGRSAARRFNGGDAQPCSRRFGSRPAPLLHASAWHKPVELLAVAPTALSRMRSRRGEPADGHAPANTPADPADRHGTTLNRAIELGYCKR
jgi:hypothetical protein